MILLSAGTRAKVDSSVVDHRTATATPPPLSPPRHSPNSRSIPIRKTEQSAAVAGAGRRKVLPPHFRLTAAARRPALALSARPATLVRPPQPSLHVPPCRWTLLARPRRACGNQKIRDFQRDDRWWCGVRATSPGRVARG